MYLDFKLADEINKGTIDGIFPALEALGLGKTAEALRDYLDIQSDRNKEMELHLEDEDFRISRRLNNLKDATDAEVVTILADELRESINWHRVADALGPWAK